MPELKTGNLGYTREIALDEYEAEIGYLRMLKENGVKEISAKEWLGEETARMMPIDDVLSEWESKLAQIQQLDAGACAEEFNY